MSACSLCRAALAPSTPEHWRGSRAVGFTGAACPRRPPFSGLAPTDPRACLEFSLGEASRRSAVKVPITRRSARGVSETVAAIRSQAEQHGSSVVAVVDHAALAQAAGLTMPATQVII